jgi:hypothetical protein
MVTHCLPKLPIIGQYVPFLVLRRFRPLNTPSMNNLTMVHGRGPFNYTAASIMLFARNAGKLDHRIPRRSMDLKRLHAQAVCMITLFAWPAGRRSHGICKLRPRITLYGENHLFDCESIGTFQVSWLKIAQD